MSINQPNAKLHFDTKNQKNHLHPIKTKKGPVFTFSLYLLSPHAKIRTQFLVVFLVHSHQPVVPSPKTHPCLPNPTRGATIVFGILIIFPLAIVIMWLFSWGT